jgi:flagellar P-ring protein precursor FlgI
LQVNHLTAGRIPEGGVVESVVRTELPSTRVLSLTLNEPDFTSATRLAAAINGELGDGTARAVDAGTVAVTVPEAYANSVADLMARLEPVPIRLDVVARVVINERTGTVVVGSDVRVAAAAVAHGNLSVRISTKYAVSQPPPLSRQGETVVVPDERLDVTEGGGQLVALEEGVSLQAVVKALNALGATPRDIIAIMQALKAAGALQAELVII